MDLNEIMRRARSLRPELDLSISEWAEQIYALEKRIYKNIILKHETDITLPEWNFESFDFPDELIVEDEYADLYVYWVVAQYDLKRNETARYANSMAAFNNLYAQYVNYINREYMPVQKSKITAGGM